MWRAVALAIFAVASISAASTRDVTTKSSSDMSKDMMSTPSSNDADMMTSSVGDARETEELKSMMDVCNDTFRIEMEFIDSLNESGSFPDETDRTPKCYVRCVLEKTGVLSEDGFFDPALTAKVFAGKRNGKVMTDVQELATICALDRNETCKCDRAYKYIKCLMEAEIKEYLTN